MRLLNVHNLEFCEFQAGNIPRYVIASHRWSGGAEATLKDFQKQRNTDAFGHKKVISFAQYVRVHIQDVAWLWVDTVCIAKTSSQEVSEAINAMFKWYSRAELCLAYLSDVSTTDLADFCRSEWFTRGWTLQELLAPYTVLFLTKEWEVIGHKGRQIYGGSGPPLNVGPSLESSIAAITLIPEHILRDYENSRSLSTLEKLAWIVGRDTTREEDLSYCLFGIFDVAIGANYGEGAEKARRRLLKEISGINDTNIPSMNHNEFSALLAGGSIRRSEAERSAKDALRRLRESFHFPLMEDRRAGIDNAYHRTYRWVLSPSTVNTRWDSFIAWLGDSRPAHSIYWINAKPGAGKSNLVRFLDEELQVDQHMQPWAEQLPVLKIRYYFWNSGTALQKTLSGLLRTVLYQLCVELPEHAMPFTAFTSWVGAHFSPRQTSSWTNFELRKCFWKLLSCLSLSVKVLFLIDGLDEIYGDEDSREELVAFLMQLASYSHVKLCVSSRPWTVFGDAFAACPNLQLEDLTAQDIETYVRGQLQSQKRYQEMLAHNPQAKNLVRTVVVNAQGVFLWVRFVVKELLHGMRDGASYEELQLKANSIPSGLDQYFARLVESIEPDHRREACTILQLALYDERDFTTLHPST